MNNATELRLFDWPTTAVPLTSTISSCGIILNFLLIMAFLKDPLKVLKSPSAVLILNIAVIDFLASCLFLLAASFRSSIFCYFTWKTIFSFDGVTNFLSVFFTTISFASYVCLSIERFCSISLPLWHRVHITIRVCRYWIIGIWILHFVLLEGIIINLQTFFHGVLAKVSFARLIFTWTMFICTLSFYLASYISIRRQRRHLQSREDTNDISMKALKIRLKNEQNFLVTITIVCFFLFLSFLPFATMIFVYVPVLDNPHGADQNDFPNVVWGIFAVTVNFSINPLVYLCRLPKYRKTFQNLYCKL